MARDEDRSLGVFKPVGHVVMSFPRMEQADAAVHELESLGLEGDEGAPAVRRLTDREMVAQVDVDLQQASPLAAIGQEINLVRAQRALAERGYHFLVVHAPDSDQATQVAQVAARHGAERAQSYGRFIIEDLIDRPGDLPQVSESPDRGLDAQTPSGLESEAGEMRRQAQDAGPDAAR